MKIGLTLSGGAARGIAHIGVYKALKEYDVKINALYGTSAGAIVASLIAADVAPDEMLDIVTRTTFLDFWTWSLPSKGIIPLTILKDKLSPYLPVDNLEDLDQPLLIGATNLSAGRHETFSTGPIIDAVMASSCIPVLFQAIEIGESYYVDGGVTRNMPAKELRDLSDYVIGCNVVHTIPEEVKKGNMRALLERSLDISLHYRTQSSYPYCDFILEPAAINNYGKFSLTKAKEIHDVGYQYMIEKMPDLLAELNRD